MPQWERTVSRRTALRVTGVTAVTALAGCPTDGDGDAQTTDESPTPERQLPAPTRGDAEAPITVAVYEDLACPHCRRYTEETEPELLTEYVEPGVVRYEWHDFPVPVAEPDSWLAANAARSVQAESRTNDGFWSFIGSVFERQEELSMDLYETLANDVGVDGETVRRDTENRTYEPTVIADREGGLERNVDGTPTVFVGDNRLEGPTFDVIRNAIEDEREA